DLFGCAPALFPERGAAGSGSAAPTATAPPPAPAPPKDECDAIAQKMRGAIIADMPKDTGSAGVAMVDKMLVAIAQSCREDSWPDAFKTCIMKATDAELVSSKKCEDVLPHDLQLKMGERLKPIIQGP